MSTALHEEEERERDVQRRGETGGVDKKNTAVANPASGFLVGAFMKGNVGLLKNLRSTGDEIQGGNVTFVHTHS